MASDPPPSSAIASPPSATRSLTNVSPKTPIALAPLYANRPPNLSPSPQFPQTHDASQAFLYPVSSSARGFIPQRPAVSFQQGARSNLGPAGAGSAPIKGIPDSAHPKLAQSAFSVPDDNGYKNTRNRSKDDPFSTQRERRVRISDGSSLYAMCRSWLKDGFHEAKPQYIDGIKSLPRPLPKPVADANLPKRKEDEEENEDSIEQLSAQDLLKRHIERAKKVRSGLREERLQRITRYKTRLALLLPPPIETLRNDVAAGN